MHKVFKLGALSAILFLILPAFCFGQGNSNHQISPDLAAMVAANAANPSAIQNVIVQFAGPPTQQDIANINAAANANVNPNGNPNPGPPQPLPNAPDLSLIGAQYYSLPLQAINALANNNPNILYITPDRALGGT